MTTRSPQQQVAFTKRAQALARTIHAQLDAHGEGVVPITTELQRFALTLVTKQRTVDVTGFYTDCVTIIRGS